MENRLEKVDTVSPDRLIKHKGGQRNVPEGTEIWMVSSWHC